MSRQFTLSQNIDDPAVRYIFNPNPSEYIPPGPPEFTSLQILEGQNVRQYPYNDQLVWEFRWASAPQSTYTNLDNYTVRNTADDIPISYFYDGDFGNFPVRYSSTTSPTVGNPSFANIANVSGTKVRVLDVVGTPIPGLFDITFSRRATYVDINDVRAPLALLENPPTFTPRYQITMRLVKVDT